MIVTSGWGHCWPLEASNAANHPIRLEKDPAEQEPEPKGNSVQVKKVYCKG